jgi:hypothetical protein
MIGVAAHDTDHEFVSEFFELFKTPWEWFVPGRDYAAALIADGHTDPGNAVTALIYGAAEHPLDRRTGMSMHLMKEPTHVHWDDSVFPVYGDVATFHGPTENSLLSAGPGAVDYRVCAGTRYVWRVGYDLFTEIRYLLQTGQPPQHAQTATLELHIAVLRQLLLNSGVSFVEVPPRPFGRDFACCLTHDVDFFGVTRHKFDRTIAGFLARASLGTFIEWLGGRRPWSDVTQNWRTVWSLPLVFLGLAPDFWRPLEDYQKVEGGLPSTFFVIPFKGRPGVGLNGKVAATRAAAYQVSEIASEVRSAVAVGSELAVHAIDAWRDADAGRAEMAELTRLTGQPAAGVRMHWLYFADDSPTCLEKAGFDYDSTCGYNDAIGYRAGTSQVFRWPGTEHLMELPLVIMDSALLSPGRMGLAEGPAVAQCRSIVTQARRFGGTVVVNWHCRSLAPERLWRRPYQELLKELKHDDRAWFATAREVVSWFRWRRSIRFSSNSAASTLLRVQAQAGESSFTGVLRVHRSGPNGASMQDLPVRGTSPCLVDIDSLESAQVNAV